MPKSERIDRPAKGRRLRRPKRVAIVVWYDAFVVQSPTSEHFIQHSVGWLGKCDSEYVHLVQTTSVDEPQVDILVIPRAMVRSIKILPG